MTVEIEKMLPLGRNLESDAELVAEYPRFLTCAHCGRTRRRMAMKRTLVGLTLCADDLSCMALKEFYDG